MGFDVQGNIPALDALRNLNVNNSAMNKSLERLSSGFRINSASDDAAGMAISQQFSADIASYNVGSQNASQATALLQVANGAMDQIDQMLTRLKELATEAASANAGADSTALNNEAQTLLTEIDRIANSTTYAGSDLLNGSFGVGVSSGGGTTVQGTNGFGGMIGMVSGQTYKFTVATSGSKFNVTVAGTMNGQSVSQTINGVVKPGANMTEQLNFAALGLTVSLNSNLSAALNGENVKSTTAAAVVFQIGTTSSANDRIGLSIGSATSAALGLSGLDLTTQANAQTALNTINTAISNLSSVQAGIGAAQNRLGYASANLSTTIQNFTAAESTIKDVDMASEMTNFTKDQILVQAGMAMLAQANAAPQQILTLFK